MSEEAASLAALAFDGVAPFYDAEFGRNPIGLYFRHVVHERLRLLFPKGARVLDLGCGTGEDALYMASLGLDVLGIDVSPGMIERAREKAAREGGAGGSPRFEVRAAEEVGSTLGVFDGAFSNFGALNCAALPAVGRAVVSCLRPGAPVAFCVVGRHPLPGLARQALTGRSARSPKVPVGGKLVSAPGLSARELRDGLGPGFSWRSCAALGVLVPAPAHEDWARRNPVAFGMLAAAERLVREWPGAREWGDHLLLLGTRS
jgi:ubiquinone/menaquinone biosynthesis C-methylase UbiE